MGVRVEAADDALNAALRYCRKRVIIESGRLCAAIHVVTASLVVHIGIRREIGGVGVCAATIDENAPLKCVGRRVIVERLKGHSAAIRRVFTSCWRGVEVRSQKEVSGERVHTTQHCTCGLGMRLRCGVIQRIPRVHAARVRRECTVPMAMLLLKAATLAVLNARTVIPCRTRVKLGVGHNCATTLAARFVVLNVELWRVVPIQLHENGAKRT